MSLISPKPSTQDKKLSLILNKNSQYSPLLSVPYQINCVYIPHRIKLSPRWIKLSHGIKPSQQDQTLPTGSNFANGIKLCPPDQTSNTCDKSCPTGSNCHLGAKIPPWDYTSPWDQPLPSDCHEIDCLITLKILCGTRVIS